MANAGLSRRRTRRGQAPEHERPASELVDEQAAMLAQQPPKTPSDGEDEGAESSTPDFDVVFQMTRDAIDLQFKVAERIDAKARGYFAFAATVFGIAQALALRPDVRENLGDWKTTFEWLALGSAFFLLCSVGVAVWTLLPRKEADVPEEKLRSLLKMSYKQHPEAGAEAINFLIGELVRRRNVNVSRNCRLTWLIVVVGLAATAAVLEVAVALRVVL